jgi:hypothetical protein
MKPRAFNVTLPNDISSCLAPWTLSSRVLTAQLRKIKFDLLSHVHIALLP